MPLLLLLAGCEGAVAPVPVASVAIDPRAAELPIGDSVQLAAVLTAADGKPLPGRTVQWTSSDTLVARVNQSGRVRGVGLGAATITASAEGTAGHAPVTVVDPHVPRHPIAFTSDRDGDPEIYLINPDGTGLRKLTDHPAADRDPAWSPDRERLVFVSNRDGDDDLYIVNVDGTGIRKVVNTPGNEGWPDWSPDGTRLVYAEFVPRPFYPGTGIRLWTVSVDGSDPAIVPQNRGDPRLPVYEPVYTRPAWSPNGRSIVYEVHPCGYSCSEGEGIDILELSTGSVTSLVRGTTRGGSNRQAYGAPKWSPRADKIAFQGRSSTSQPVGIYVVDSSGGQPNRLLFNAQPVFQAPTAWHPSWSPDGRYLAFATNRDGNWEIYLVRGDGTALRRVTDHPGLDGAPAWD